MAKYDDFFKLFNSFMTEGKPKDQTELEEKRFLPNAKIAMRLFPDRWSMTWLAKYENTESLATTLANSTTTIRTKVCIF